MKNLKIIRQVGTIMYFNIMLNLMFNLSLIWQWTLNKNAYFIFIHIFDL